MKEKDIRVAEISVIKGDFDFLINCFITLENDKLKFPKLNFVYSSFNVNFSELLSKPINFNYRNIFEIF
jgi:hypothetical protein